jgi:hypothetical protein
MSRPTDTADVKAMLQARIESLAKHLAPDGQRAGRYWMARNPTRDDRRIGSFWIAISGTPGAWRDEATGDKGDVFGLIGYCTGLPFRDVMQWARDWLGIARLDDGKIREARAAVRAMEGADEKEAARLLAHNRRKAFALWLKASEKLTATPVETYLRTRCIDLAALRHPPRALRFAPRRHTETGMTLPAMLALMSGPDPSGGAEAVPYAVHCTFLANDGMGKAPVTPVRKMWPSFKGGAIRLSNGETKLRPSEAAKQGLLDTLCLCEGVEDGLSIAMACPELRVWAVGSLGNLAHQRLPECCAEVIVAADNDWGKPQAMKALDTAIETLVAQGRPVRVARSPVGKDANDALLSGASAAHQQPRGGHMQA